MSKPHTPGPWLAEWTRSYYAIKAASEKAQRGGPKTIASVYHYGPSPESDAKLMAFAPQLLVSLTLIEQLACYATEIDTSVQLDALLQIGAEARAAIAKATGATA